MHTLNTKWHSLSESLFFESILVQKIKNQYMNHQMSRLFCINVNDNALNVIPEQILIKN